MCYVNNEFFHLNTKEFRMLPSLMSMIIFIFFSFFFLGGGCGLGGGGLKKAHKPMRIGSKIMYWGTTPLTQKKLTTIQLSSKTCIIISVLKISNKPIQQIATLQRGSLTRTWFALNYPSLSQFIPQLYKRKAAYIES